MRGRSSVWVRTRRVVAQREAATVAVLAVRYAAELGCTPAELLAEAAALRRRAQAAGATTTEALVAFAAAERGISADELRAELDLLRTGAG